MNESVSTTYDLLASLCDAGLADRHHRRRFLGAVGISMSRHAFDTERAQLEETLRDVARFQPSAEVREVLDRGPEARLASAVPVRGGSRL